MLDIAHGSSHHPDFRTKRPKKNTGLPCSRLASPKLYLGGFSFSFLLLPSIFVYHGLIIGLVTSHLREEGVCMHKIGWGGGMDLCLEFTTSHSLFPSSRSRTGRALFGISSQEPRLRVVSPSMIPLQRADIGSRGIFSSCIASAWKDRREGLGYTPAFDLESYH